MSVARSSVGLLRDEVDPPSKSKGIRPKPRATASSNQLIWLCESQTIYSASVLSYSYGHGTNTICPIFKKENGKCAENCDLNKKL